MGTVCEFTPLIWLGGKKSRTSSKSWAKDSCNLGSWAKFGVLRPDPKLDPSFSWPLINKHMHFHASQVGVAMGNVDEYGS